MLNLSQLTIINLKNLSIMAKKQKKVTALQLHLLKKLEEIRESRAWTTREKSQYLNLKREIEL